MDYSINFPNLGIYLEHVGKNIMIGNFSIAYYGIVIACGMLAGIYMASYVAKQLGQNPDVYFDLAICDIICAVCGARIYYVVFRWSYYKDNPLSIFNLREGGLAVYGGLIAGVIATFAFGRIRKLPILKLLDVASYGMITGQIIGRWGNFFNREAYGGYTDNLLAMQLPVSAVRSNEITAEQLAKIVTLNGVDYIQVHPTFLYESLWNLGVLLLMFLLLRHYRFDGELFALYLFGYGVGRFWIEALRTDQLLLPVVNYPVSRALAGLLVLISALWIIIGNLRVKKKNPMTEEKDVE